MGLFNFGAVALGMWGFGSLGTLVQLDFGAVGLWVTLGLHKEVLLERSQEFPNLQCSCFPPSPGAAPRANNSVRILPPWPSKAYADEQDAACLRTPSTVLDDELAG